MRRNRLRAASARPRPGNGIQPGARNIASAPRQPALPSRSLTAASTIAASMPPPSASMVARMISKVVRIISRPSSTSAPAGTACRRRNVAAGRRLHGGHETKQPVMAEYGTGGAALPAPGGAVGGQQALAEDGTQAAAFQRRGADEILRLFDQRLAHQFRPRTGTGLACAACGAAGTAVRRVRRAMPRSGCGSAPAAWRGGRVPFAVAQPVSIVVSCGFPDLLRTCCTAVTLCYPRRLTHLVCPPLPLP